MVKYKQGEIYDLDEIIADAGKDINPRWAESNFGRYRKNFPSAMYLGVHKAYGRKYAAFGLLYPDGRPGYIIVWRFNPELHEDVPADYNLHKRIDEERKARIRKIMETPEYKFITHKKGEDVPMPETLKDPQTRKKIFEAIKKGDVEKLERLRKLAEVEKPEPGKRSIAKKFEQAEEETIEPEKMEEPQEETRTETPKRVTIEVPAEHVEKLKEIAEKHGWKILLGMGLVMLLR